MYRKYEFTNKNKKVKGRTLHQIRALRDFGYFKKGDIGGWIEKESNLSHDGECWISGEACVFEDACVFENAWVHDNAQVFGEARIYGRSRVSDNARVGLDSYICGNTIISGYMNLC